MNNKFDELTKSLAQSVTRRAALKKFGFGIAGMALACFGLANKAKATTVTGYCETYGIGSFHQATHWFFSGYCIGVDSGVNYRVFSTDCPQGKTGNAKGNKPCSFTI